MDTPSDGASPAEHRTGTGGYAHTFTYDATGNRLTRDDDTDLTT